MKVITQFIVVRLSGKVLCAEGIQNCDNKVQLEINPKLLADDELNLLRGSTYWDFYSCNEFYSYLTDADLLTGSFGRVSITIENIEVDVK